VARKAQIKKARKADFGVFSDDSVEDIMMQLPATINTSRPEDADTSQPGNMPDDSPADTDTYAKEVEEVDEGRVESEVPKSTNSSSDCNPATDHGAHPSDDPASKLRERYAYSAANHGGLKALPFPATFSRKTPLQRLGLAALSRSKSLNSLPTRKAESDGPDGGYDSDCTTRWPARVKGSEDLIVPDSQDDEDEEEEGPFKSQTFNIKKFVFAPV
jgi:exonuclease-1